MLHSAANTNNLFACFTVFVKKYNIIYADPPWQYKDKRGNDPRYGAMDYPTMTVDEIKALSVRDIADVNCMLFLWVTFPLLIEGLEVMSAWGFRYRTQAFSWIKTNKRQNLQQTCFLPTEPDLFFGIGYYTKSNCELCLLGVKGKPFKQNDTVSSVIIAPITRHSEKPAEARDRIVQLCGDFPRIELFARQRVCGWDAWGNEIESDITLTAQANNRLQRTLERRG